MDRGDGGGPTATRDGAGPEEAVGRDRLVLTPEEPAASSAEEERRVGRLIARTVCIVDARGAERIVMSAGDDGAAEVSVLDEDGDRRLQLRVSGSESCVRAFGESGAAVVEIVAADDSHGFVVRDGSGRTRVAAYEGQDGVPAVTILDEGGVQRVHLFAEGSEGRSGLLMRSSSGRRASWIEVDPEGNSFTRFKDGSRKGKPSGRVSPSPPRPGDGSPSRPSGDIDPALSWFSDLVLDMPVLDVQHREIFECLLSLEREMENGGSVESTRAALEFLSKYVGNHFGVEEMYMGRYFYPQRKAHEAEHAAFRGWLAEVSSQFRDEDDAPELAAQVVFHVRDWLKGHVAATDRAMVGFLREKQGGR